MNGEYVGKLKEATVVYLKMPSRNNGGLRSIIKTIQLRTAVIGREYILNLSPQVVR
jgi:hypothetical protein